MASTTSDGDEWDWVLSSRADDQLSQIDSEAQQRIVSKLDEGVSSEWREPEDFLDPLANSPFRKLRVGDYRLACRLLRERRLLSVESVRNRSGAYTADD